jgi:4-amino-4-deoxy-L-arabinose transferase-like glycosyltransferase
LNQVWEILSKRPALCLFLLALIIRLAALIADPSYWQKSPTKDSGVYHEVAKELVSGHGFSLGGKLTARITPLYPVFLAGVYRVTDFSRFTVLLLQIIFGSLMVYYLYLLGDLIFSRRVALIAGVLAALYWPLIIIELKMLTEALFIPLLVAGGYYTVASFKTKRPATVAAAAAVTGLAILTRSIILYFSAVVAFWFVWDYYRERNKRSLFAAGLYLCVLMLVQAPWVVRNYKVFNHFIPTNTLSGTVLFSGNLPRDGKIFGYNLREWQLEPSQRYILDLPEVEFDKALTKLVIEDFLEKRPQEVAKLFLLKVLFFWIPFDWEVLGQLDGIFNPWFFLVFLWALFWLWHMKWRGEYFFPVALVVYFTLICLVAYGSPRIRLPIEPFLLLFASAGWQELESRSATNRLRYYLAAVMLAVLIVGYVYGEAIKEAGSALAKAVGIW